MKTKNRWTIVIWEYILQLRIKILLVIYNERSLLWITDEEKWRGRKTVIPFRGIWKFLMQLREEVEFFWKFLLISSNLPYSALYYSLSIFKPTVPKVMSAAVSIPFNNSPVQSMITNLVSFSISHVFQYNSPQEVLSLVIPLWKMYLLFLSLGCTILQNTSIPNVY